MIATKVAPSKNGRKAQANKSQQVTAPIVRKLEIPELQLRRMSITLIGTTPLITHRWSEKARKEIRDKQCGVARLKKEPRDPAQEFRDALYIIPGKPEKYGMNVLAFKNAAVDAAVALGIYKTEVRRAFRVEATHMTKDGPLVEIVGSEPIMREDSVRVTMKTSLAYRPEFTNWKVTIPITFDERQISASQLVTLFRQGGFSTGVGEWRQEKNGLYGAFDVEGVS